MRADVRRDVGTGEPYAREALRRELELVHSWGIVGEKRAKEIAKVADSGPLEDVNGWRQVLVDEGFEEVYLELLREAREAAGVSG